MSSSSGVINKGPLFSNFKHLHQKIKPFVATCCHQKKDVFGHAQIPKHFFYEKSAKCSYIVCGYMASSRKNEYFNRLIFLQCPDAALL